MRKVILNYIFQYIVALTIMGCMASAPDIKKSTCNDDYLRGWIENLSDGQVLELEDREYCITRSLWLSRKKNVTIRGQENTRIISQDLNYAILYVSEAKSILIENVFMKHMDPPKPEEYCSGAVILVQVSDNVTIQNSELNGSGTYGVEIYKSKNVNIVNNTVHNNSIAAFRLNAGSKADTGDPLRYMSHIQIQDNHIFNNPKVIESNWPENVLSEILFMQNNTIR